MVNQTTTHAAEIAARQRQYLFPSVATYYSEPVVLEQEADVRAAELGRSAARLDEWRARSTWLPRVNAFGRFDWHSLDGPYEGDENWTVGIMAQWTPIAGLSRYADHRRTAGRAAAARAQAEAAGAQAELEMVMSANRLEVALERLILAERAVAQAQEAHRIVGRRYDGGLATIVELLDASATETRTRLERAHSLYTVIAQAAGRVLATGRDPGVFAELDRAPLEAKHAAGTGVVPTDVN